MFVDDCVYSAIFSFFFFFLNLHPITVKMLSSPSLSRHCGISAHGVELKKNKKRTSLEPDLSSHKKKEKPDCKGDGDKHGRENEDLRWKQTLTFNGLYWSEGNADGREGGREEGQVSSRQWRESERGREGSTGREREKADGEKEGGGSWQGEGGRQRGCVSGRGKDQLTLLIIFPGSSHGT